MLIRVNASTFVALDAIAHVDVSDGAVRLVMKQGGFVLSDLTGDELARLSAAVVPAISIGEVIAWRVPPDGAEPVLSNRRGGDA